MGLLDDVYGIPEEPPLDSEGLAPPYVAQSDPDVRAAMDREWGLPPTAPVQPEAQPEPQPPEPVAEGTAPGFASWAALNTEPEPDGFGQFLEQKEQPKEGESPLKGAFDLGSEEKALEGSPVPEASSGPDLQAQEAERLREKAASDPIGFGAEMQQKAEEEARHFAERRAAEEEAVAAKQAEDAATFKTAIAKATEDSAHIRQRVEELSKREPEGFFSSDWDAGKVVGLIKAIAIGFISPLHGLMAISGEMQTDKNRQIAATQNQIALLGKQAGAIGEELAAHGDMWKADQAVTLAMARRVPAMIAAERAKYDKNGSIARSLVQAEQLAASQFMAAQQKADAAGLDRHIKIATEERNAAKELRDAAKFRRDMAPKSAGPLLSPDYIKQVYGLDVPGPMTEKQLKSMVGIKKDVQDLTGGGPKATEQATKELELEQKQRADVVLDPFTQEPVGKPNDSDPTARRGTADKIEAYGNLRTEYGRLIDYINKAPREFKAFERWKSENRTKVETMRKQVASTYAKAVDPVGAVSDKSEAAAKEVLPDVDGWTTKKNPRAVYEVIIKTADDRIENHAKGHIDGYKPGTLTRHYQEYDKTLLADPVKPADEPGLIERESGLEKFKDAGGKEHKVVKSVGDPIDA